MQGLKDTEGLFSAVPLGALSVLKRLEDAGHEAYIVGGSVRDILLGKIPSDFDITTSARPNETEEVFSDLHMIETGLKHGTVTVVSDGEPYEITTFRADGEYKDGRRPESVFYSDDLTTDLERRDLTVNAMAYSPKTGLIDVFGGSEDLKNGVLRAVGDPERRFTEDALRILRALRFSAVYGFRIEDGTALAAKRLCGRIALLSGERVFSELKKLICGDYAERILMEFPEIICEVLPELKPAVGFSQYNPHHVYDVYTHSVKALSYVKTTLCFVFRRLCTILESPRPFRAERTGSDIFTDIRKRAFVWRALRLRV